MSIYCRKATIIQSQTLALISNSQLKREGPVEIQNYLAVTAVMITCNDTTFTTSIYCIQVTKTTVNV